MLVTLSMLLLAMATTATQLATRSSPSLLGSEIEGLQDPSKAYIIKSSLGAMFGSFGIEFTPSDDDGAVSGYVRNCVSSGQIITETAQESKVTSLGYRMTLEVTGTQYDAASGIGAFSLGTCTFGEVPGYSSPYKKGANCTTIAGVGKCMYMAAVAADQSSNTVTGIVQGGGSGDPCQMPVPQEVQTFISQQATTGSQMPTNSKSICPLGGGAIAGIVIASLAGVAGAVYAGLVFAGVVPRPQCGGPQPSSYAAMPGSGGHGGGAPTTYNGSAPPAPTDGATAPFGAPAKSGFPEPSR